MSFGIGMNFGSSGFPAADPPLSLVEFNVWGDEGPLEGAIVRAKLLEPYSITSEWEVGRQTNAAVTDADGIATLQLIRNVEFQTGGTYCIEISDPNGIRLSVRHVQVPDDGAINSTQLIES